MRKRVLKSTVSIGAIEYWHLSSYYVTTIEMWNKSTFFYLPISSCWLDFSIQFDCVTVQKQLLFSKNELSARCGKLFMFIFIHRTKLLQTPYNIEQSKNCVDFILFQLRCVMLCPIPWVAKHLFLWIDFFCQPSNVWKYGRRS